MARQKIYGERVSTGIRFDPEVLTALQGEADERAVSVNLLVNRAAVEWLERQKLVRADVSMPATPRIVEMVGKAHEEPVATYVPPPAAVKANTKRMPTGGTRQVEPRFKKGAKS